MNTTWENMLNPFATARGAAFASFTTAQDISPTLLPQLAANELKIGSRLELEAFGEFSTTATPTLQIEFLYGVAAGAVASGGVILAASGAITTGTATAWPWHAKWVGIVTTVGTSGVIYGHGILDLGTSLTAFAASAMPVTAAARSVTIDTTVAKTLGVGAAYGASSASNIVRVDHFTAKLVNQNLNS